MGKKNRNPIDKGYYNPEPNNPFITLGDLRSVLTRKNETGDAYLDYLLKGNYFSGKGVWVNDEPATQHIYEDILSKNPYLHSDSPFNPYFNKNKVRQPGENPIALSRMCDAKPGYQDISKNHQLSVASGSGQKRALFCGGPAPKIASLLLSLNAKNNNIVVSFLFDGPEQSNESGSASYEHINHAKGPRNNNSIHLTATMPFNFGTY